MSTPLSAATFTPLADLDPATPGDPFTRLSYHYGQLLGAEDFTAEQRYFLLRSRLHNALLHGVGTAWGLRVRHEATADPAGLRLICEPGLAIDALGREVYVPQRVCLDVTGLASTPFWADLAPPSDAAEGSALRRVYVVLSYRACLTEPAPAIAPPCSDSEAGLVPSRVMDGYRLCLQAEAPPDPAATQRDGTALGEPADPRGKLLQLILAPPVDLARFWSGADEAPLLLAVLDLEPVGEPVERVRLAGEIDNGVRALLPSVQAVADLALGVRLDGRPGAAAFQVAGLTAAAEATGEIVLTITTTYPVNPAALALPRAVRVLVWDAGAGAWNDLPLTGKAPLAAPAVGLRLTVAGIWPAGTTFQVQLAGTGDQALLDTAGHSLAGVAGEAVPAGSGRDANLYSIYNPGP
jgi:hypothetical protein